MPKLLRVEKKVVCGQIVEVEVYAFEMPKNPDTMQDIRVTSFNQRDGFFDDSTWALTPNNVMYSYDNYIRPSRG